MIHPLAVTNSKGVREDMLAKLLLRVAARKVEATIDIRDMPIAYAETIVERAKAVGLNASGDGKFLLIRDLRHIDQTK